jgi:fatty acid desaturase
MQFFTGNIGLHHVDHLHARIPSYNLQRAHDENSLFHHLPTRTLWDALRTVRLKLWDEEHRTPVTFAQASREQPTSVPGRYISASPRRTWTSRSAKLGCDCADGRSVVHG